MFATLTDNGRYMVGMTYWRKGGEEPPRRADETGVEGVANIPRGLRPSREAVARGVQICRGGFAAVFVCLKCHFPAIKIFYDLRLDLRFVWYNGGELGDGH